MTWQTGWLEPNRGTQGGILRVEDVFGQATTILSLLLSSFITRLQAMSAVVHPTLPPQPVPSYPRQSLNVAANGQVQVSASMVAGGSSNKPTASTGMLKRKRATRYSVQFSEVKEFDQDGRLRDVIVIEDTPPPQTISPATTHNPNYSTSYQPPLFSAPIRTRARAAAEAQALSSGSSSIIAPIPKKRKREPQEEVRAPPVKKPVRSSLHVQPSAPTKSTVDHKNGVVQNDVSCPVVIGPLLSSDLAPAI